VLTNRNNLHQFLSGNTFSHFLTRCVLLVFAAVAVSKDHKPDQTDERQRIEDAGGFVMWAGTPVIAFSS
jgi:hypothetical protein